MEAKVHRRAKEKLGKIKKIRTCKKISSPLIKIIPNNLK